MGSYSACRIAFELILRAVAAESMHLQGLLRRPRVDPPWKPQLRWRQEGSRSRRVRLRPRATLHRTGPPRGPPPPRPVSDPAFPRAASESRGASSPSGSECSSFNSDEIERRENVRRRCVEPAWLGEDRGSRRAALARDRTSDRAIAPPEVAGTEETGESEDTEEDPFATDFRRDEQGRRVANPSPTLSPFSARPSPSPHDAPPSRTTRPAEDEGEGGRSS